MSNIPRLVLDRVSRSYPNGVAALREVSLQIGAGMFGLLGPNGAGKSSLMRTIATLQAPDQGTVHFDGREVFTDVTAHRARLGYLPQDFGVYPGVSAQQLLDHLAVLKGVLARGERRDQVQALLQQVNLWDARHRAVSGFSGGMRQRFGIAQALLGAPQLLIVDEPTAGLDPVERTRFYNLLSRVAESMVVILSTHIVEDVRQLCPRMAILSSGRVVCDGVPDDLVREMDGRLYERRLTRDEEAHPPVWASAAAPVHELTRFRHAGRVTVRLLASAAPDDASAATPATLEDVYLRAIEAA
jgi:ABC-type multidrug transport system ATPase subunit